MSGYSTPSSPWWQLQDRTVTTERRGVSSRADDRGPRPRRQFVAPLRNFVTACWCLLYAVVSFVAQVTLVLLTIVAIPVAAFAILGLIGLVLWIISLPLGAA